MTGESGGTPGRPPVPQQRTDHGKFTTFGILRGEGTTFTAGQDIEIDFELEALKALDDAVFAVSVYRTDGDWVIGQNKMAYFCNFALFILVLSKTFKNGFPSL